MHIYNHSCQTTGLDNNWPNSKVKSDTLYTATSSTLIRAYIGLLPGCWHAWGAA